MMAKNKKVPVSWKKECDFKCCVFKTSVIKKLVVLLQTHFPVMFVSYISLFF